MAKFYRCYGEIYRAALSYLVHTFTWDSDGEPYEEGSSHPGVDLGGTLIMAIKETN